MITSLESVVMGQNEMKLLAKIFLTYAAISMTSGLFLMMFDMATNFKFHINNGLEAILWMGPMMLAISIGAPYGIYYFWFGKGRDI